ncbi:MAG: TolC family protein [Gemmataceae bacterium]|nr:TolC family protein [Gemmataceae bacterium]
MKSRRARAGVLRKAVAIWLGIASLAPAEPITLPAALRLADAQALDIQIAQQKVAAAGAVYDRARVLWVPNLQIGGDYTRHDGQIQDIRGTVFGTSRSATFAGLGPQLYLPLSEACFAPLAARQDHRARMAEQRAATQDTTLSVAESYFGVVQAGGEIVLAREVIVPAARELVRRTTALSEGLTPPLEVNRARAELARREAAVATLTEKAKTATAELARVIRLTPGVSVEPAEPPDLLVTLVEPDRTVDELIPIALTARPELAARQAVVQATLARLKQERLRPLTPSILLRGISTSNPGLGAGVFGGGINGDQRAFNARSDWDVQIVWELQNFGLGNRARVRERKAEYDAALLDVFRTQDRVAAEVVQAHAAVEAARQRMSLATGALAEARELVSRSMEGLSQTRRAGELIVLVVRPAEAVAALQTLSQAGTDYFQAAADFNRAQFRLYRAAGQPVECLPVQLDAVTITVK